MTKPSNPDYVTNVSPERVAAKHIQWRQKAVAITLTRQERMRLEWMIYYESEAQKSVIQTCRHFGISRKTFYKWLKRFQSSRQNPESLKNIPRASHKRSWELSIAQEKKIVELRKRYIHYGKKKLKVLYRKFYGEEISCWKIERVIRKNNLYPVRGRRRLIPRKLSRVMKKAKRSFAKLEKEKKIWFLFQMDIMAIYDKSHKRYIVTAVDRSSKLGYARMYESNKTKIVEDFLSRLNHLIQQPLGKISRGETVKLFHLLRDDLGNGPGNRGFSRIDVPREINEVERFNETLEYEWLYDGNMNFNCDRFNNKLAAWLCEYNFNRPHQSLDYMTPVEYIEALSKKARQVKMIPSKKLINTVVDYILILNIEEFENLSVKTISTDLGVNRTRLWRNFKKLKKMTLKEYIFRVKINQAAFLLRDQAELSVKEIGEKIGYYCYNYFIKVFKTYFGVTPGRYKEIANADAGELEFVNKS